MMALKLPLLLLLFLTIPLGVVIALSIFYTLRTRHHSIRGRESIYECAQCGHVYAVARNRPMDHCPHCSHLNDAVRT